MPPHGCLVTADGRVLPCGGESKGACFYATIVGVVGSIVYGFWGARLNCPSCMATLENKNCLLKTTHRSREYRIKQLI